MEFSKRNWRWRSRRGLSFVEFVGCLVSMVGGVLLGSLYLGIDIQKMAVGVLEQAQVVAPGYFGTAAKNPPAEAVAATSLSNESNESGATEVSETTAARDSSDVTSTIVMAKSDDSESGSRSLVAKPEPTVAEQLAATRAYWDGLTAIMLAEVQGRLRGDGNPEEWELYDYLSQRKRGHERALAELADLEQYGVDERLVGHGEQVIAWHQSGVKLFENALSLLSDGPGAKLTGPFAQSWQSAATQLRMEETLVVERHKAVANYLNREYAAEAPFIPAFQQQ